MTQQVGSTAIYRLWLSAIGRDDQRAAEDYARQIMGRLEFGFEPNWDAVGRARFEAWVAEHVTPSAHARRLMESLRVLVCLVAVWGLASSVRAQEAPSLRTPILFAVAGQTADVVSTLTSPGREMNLLLTNGQGDLSVVKLVAVKAGVTAATVWIARRAAREGHPAIARGLLYLTGGVGFGAAGWNVSVAVRMGR